MKNKVALITGAASGIGLLTAERLAARGCRVVCGDIKEGAVAEVAARLRAQGGEALALPLDVASRGSVQSFVAEAVRAFGGVDYLANCAGIWEVKPTVELAEDAWDRVLAVNLKGTFLCCQAAIPQMLKAGGGAIVNIASIAGRNGGNYCGAHYAASKGGVAAFTMNIARELGPQGIRVNAIAPGVTDTPMTAVWPEQIISGVVARTPLGRLGQPGDIADAIVFLLSDEARFITGETLEVNGGLLTH